MSDLIDRQAAIDAMLKLQAEDDEAYGCRIPEGFDGDRAKEALEQLPSAQPEIIRCKDCKHYTPVTANCNIRGKGLHLIRGMNDFCSRAERRTDG